MLILCCYIVQLYTRAVPIATFLFKPNGIKDFQSRYFNILLQSSAGIHPKMKRKFIKLVITRPPRQTLLFWKTPSIPEYFRPVPNPNRNHQLADTQTLHTLSKHLALQHDFTGLENCMTLVQKIYRSGNAAVKNAVENIFMPPNYTPST